MDMAESFVRIIGSSDKEEDEEERSRIFSQLKPYCLELLELSQNLKKHASSIPALLHLLRSSPPNSLQPFFESSQNKSESSDYKRVSDKAAEGVLECLEELLKKCHLSSMDQMVVVLKKLTYAALLSPSEASEEFCEGVIKCFRAQLLNLHHCSNQSCLCKQSLDLPLYMA